MAIQQLPCELAGTHGIFCGVTASGVRQHGVALRGYHVQQTRFIRVLAQIGTAHGKGDNLRTAGFNRMAGFSHVPILTCAYQQPGLVYPTGDFKRLVFGKRSFRTVTHALHLNSLKESWKRNGKAVINRRQ